MGMLGEILGKMLNEQNAVDQSFPNKAISNMKRLAAVLIAHYDQAHPEIARHLTRAYTALEAANTAAEKAGKVQNPTPQVGPKLQFSGAQLGGEPGTAAPAPTATGVM